VAELWIGIYKKDSGKGGITYRQALDESLCFGWIDGVRKRIDADAYVQRFSPRTAKSYWSAINIARATALTKVGRMHAAGLAAFERRDRQPPNRYSFERPQAQLDPVAEASFRTNTRAWDFFQSDAPWYRRTAIHWVTSAKKEETRLRRLQILIRDSAARRRIGLVKPK
jgi:uncharacterized protein YdeI (YjbR/CyaY-like superfamily)